VGIGLGLVGLGKFGASFAPLFKSHPLVDRIALCDLEADRVGAYAANEFYRDKLSPRDVFASFDDICGTDLDALVIITQPWLHAPQAVQAMESGKHVYSAVPVIMLPDGDEILDWCDRLVETARRTGMRYMLGETTCYRPETMFCRRKAAEGAFGDFVHADGHYLHDVDVSGSNLRQVRRHRTTGRAGREWLERMESYRARGVHNGPMHYPTHSTSGPINVMRAHAAKVSAWGFRDRTADEFFGEEFSNETALFRMSNGATMRICEHRQIGHPCEETFSLFGTRGAYRERRWGDRERFTEMTVEQMRDPLPEQVETLFKSTGQIRDIYGGHGGSHPYLVHEFVSSVVEDRQPMINVWEAVRYMAPGVMAHKSALRDGELLDVPDWGGPEG
jgi:predicted dehydrogenase